MKDVKAIGASGQLYLGREYAGRSVLVEQPEPGVWVIRTATVIPDNELWLHSPEVRAKLDEAMAWANEHPVEKTAVEDLERLRDA